MSELRKDPIVQRWVIIAAERGQRPSDFRSETTVKGNQSEGVSPLPAQ
jgi:UDPglucose--hexose-1-phosphate uridylyltransferase